MSLDWQYDGRSPGSPEGVIDELEGVEQEAGAWQPHEDLLYELPSGVARPHVDQSQLLCRTGCGFYGFPAWEGHCSKCYKELHANKSKRATKISRPVFDPTNIKNKVSRSVSDVSYLPGKASMLINKKIDKLDEKRRHQLNKHKNNNLVKSLFGKTSFHKSTTPGGSAGRSNTTLETSVNQELDAFLQTLSKEGGGAIRKQVSVCVDKLRRNLDTQSMEDTADQLQELYATVQNMCSQHQAFAGMSGDDVTKATNLTERYVTTRLHTQLCAVVNARCEEQDLAIQHRIRSLAWISADLLECKLDDADESMASVLDPIIGELIELDSRAVPSEKLSILVSCCHQMMSALNERCSSAASADDFLPALIYCVIRANPPMLHSNITYITNFAQHQHLQSGEAGYYFTNLCCAVAFIEKVCGASLGLTEQEFEWFMSGLALPRQPNPPASVTALTNTSQRYERAIESIDDITQSYSDTMKEIDQIQQHISLQVKEAVHSHPLEQKPAHTSAGIRRLLNGTDEQFTLDTLSVPPKWTEELLKLTDKSISTTDGSTPKPVVPDKLEASSEECEEAFKLYYSLEDFMTPEGPSPSHVASCATLTNNRGSLLDDPILDNTVPLLDQSIPQNSNVGDCSVSLLDQPVSPQASTSLLPLPQYTGFRVQSNQIMSISCDTGPSSIPNNMSLMHVKDSGCMSLPFDAALSTDSVNLYRTSSKVSPTSIASVHQPDLVQRSSTSSTNKRLQSSPSVDPAFRPRPSSLVKKNNTNQSVDILFRDPSSTTDALASPGHLRANLPPPLQPVISPLPGAQPTNASSNGVSQSPSIPASTGERKDALETVVDVLAGIAESIDQLL